MNKERMIVLKKYKWSESDLIIHALSPSGTRIHLLARGALASQKRFSGGVLEPTHFIEAVLKKGRTPESLDVLEEATMLESFDGLRSDYDRLHLALGLVSAVDRSSPGGEIPGIFNLLGHALQALAAGASSLRIEAQFSLKFLCLHGVLEQEDWMTPYLSKSFHADDVPNPTTLQSHILSERMQLFIARAE